MVVGIFMSLTLGKLCGVYVGAGVQYSMLHVDCVLWNLLYPGSYAIPVLQSQGFCS